MPAKADWTFMVFMAADNDLAREGEKDLAQMRQVGSSERVNVVAEFDGAGDHGTQRIHIAKDGINETVETIGETDSGHPDVLFNFISWAAEKFPAKRYALILWSHGDGWEPAEVDGVAGSSGLNDGGTTERTSGSLSRAFFRTPLKEKMRDSGSTERAILSDNGTGHSLDTIELDNVLKRAVDTIGQPFDLMGMDACLMSNLEVIYQLRERVRYFVASEIKAPGEGWPYDVILGRLLTNPNISTADFARHIVTDYVKYYVDDDFSDYDVIQAAYDVSQIQNLVKPIDELAGELTLGLTENIEVEEQLIWDALRNSNALRNTVKFSDNSLMDIGHFCKELSQTGEDSKIKEAAARVVEAHRTGEGCAIIEEARDGSKVKDLCGASIYFPIKSEISTYYGDLAFSQNVRWSEMLRIYNDLRNASNR